MAGTALIVLAGQVSRQDFEMAGGYDLAIAVDAGMTHFINFGMKPDILLGDFDSIEKNALEIAMAQNIEIIVHPSKKDKSDSELALEYASLKGFKKVVLLGATGGDRPDHIAFNMALFHLEDRLGIKIDAISDGYRYFTLNGSIDLKSRPGMNVSVLAMDDDVFVKLSGLLYPLNGLLRRGSTLGLSNVATSDFSIETKGKVLVFVQQL